MTQQKNSTQANQHLSLIKPIIIGAVIGLILISFFLLSVGEPNPEWGKLWRLKPLVIVPFAGAMGCVFYYIMIYLSHFRGLNKTVAILLSFIVFIIGLWLGTVLGLNGTYWH